MQLDSQGDTLLIVSEKGLGKRTLMNDYTVQNRGGKGVRCYKITERTGNIVGVKAVNESNEIMMITTEGIIIRMPVAGISVFGRMASGVKLMNLEDEVKIAGIAKVRESGVEQQDTATDTVSGTVSGEAADKHNSDNENQQIGQLIERAEADREDTENTDSGE